MSKTEKMSYRRGERRKRIKHFDQYAWVKSSTWRTDQSKLLSGEFGFIQEGIFPELLQGSGVEDEKRL